VAVYDDIIFKVVRDAEADLERRLDANVMYFSSEIRMNVFPWFREAIEKLAQRPEKKEAIAICLTTTGGQAEVVEKLVEVVRNHYNLVHFVVPVAAMSAGTIFCMSGDKIYMGLFVVAGADRPSGSRPRGKILSPGARSSRQSERDHREIASQHDHACRVSVASKSGPRDAAFL